MRALVLRLLSIGMAAVVSATAASATVPSTRSRVPVLSGMTTIVDSGRHAMSTVISLRRDVSLPGSCTSPGEVRIRGDANDVMLTLVRTPYPAGTARGDEIFSVGRLHLGSRAMVFDSFCAQRVLRAGHYRLVLQHSAGTARVRLTLPGRSEGTRLALHARSRAVLRRLPALGPRETASVQQLYGAYADLRSRGAIVAIAYVPARATVIDDFSDCSIPPTSTPLPPAIAFSPACPTGVRGSFLLVGPASEVGTLYIGGYWNVAPGRWGEGFSYDNAGVTLPAYAIASWVPFD